MAPYPLYIKAVSLILLLGGGMSFSQVNALQLDQTVRLCEGETIELTARGKNAEIFQWLRNGQVYVSQGELGEVVSINTSGVYEVMSINELECTSEVSDAVKIEFLPPPILKLTQPAILCEGGGIDITQSIEGYDPATYEYTILSPSGKNLKMEDITDVKESGIYQVQAKYKDMDCSSAVSKLEVEISDEPIHALFDYKVKGMDPKGLILANDEIIFQSHSIGENLQYEWDFGDGTGSQLANPKHSFAAQGIYLVQLSLTNAFGCESSMEMRIEVNEAHLIMIPSGFTPLENENQTFRPKMRGIAAYEMYIFNTWGDLLYEMKSMEDPGWDGKTNGKLGPNGNYVYRANFTTVDGKKVSKSGVFTLIR
ncbi:MAG TPA: PKD domain-containing protein [Anditalea sp.]|nr:PKD domain-containing protein [Anditalea sp.]